MHAWLQWLSLDSVIFFGIIINFKLVSFCTKIYGVTVPNRPLVKKQASELKQLAKVSNYEHPKYVHVE
jgi:hypothetical protein